jgi:hypothetical protein
MIKPIIFQKGGTPASAQDIRAFEAEFMLLLPTAFAEFCSKYNGGFPSDENRFYSVPENFREFHDEYSKSTQGHPHGVGVDIFFGLAKTFPACDVRPELLSLRKVSVIKLFPISTDLFGNSVVLREDDIDGTVYWRDHELWEAPERPYLMPIAQNLETFYNSLTRDPYADK